MSENAKKFVQWKNLWQTISGINLDTPQEEVQSQLHNVADELEQGLTIYKKFEKDGSLKLIVGQKGPEKLLPFTKKLAEFLDIDVTQCWEIVRYYLVNEYHGTGNSLLSFIGTESNMVKLLHDIWGFHSLERMTILKILKHMLEFSGNILNHPYSNEYRNVLNKIGLKNLRKSYIQQLEHLTSENLSQRFPHSEYVTTHAKLTVCAERTIREINEILHILIHIIHQSGILKNELEKLVKIFKQKLFVKIFQYLDFNNSAHKGLLTKITYSEVAVFLMALNGNEVEVQWIEDVVKLVEVDIVSMHHSPEHGPVLLAWMLLNFQRPCVQNDEDKSIKYRQFGTKAVQLQVFGYLHALISHRSFKDTSVTAIVVRKVLYNQLCRLCDLFDSDGSVASHHMIYDLLGELLKTSSNAESFCFNDDDGVRSLYNSALENFPVVFVPLSKIAHGLSLAGAKYSTFIHWNELEQLPIYTEEKSTCTAALRSSDNMDEDVDEYVLAQNYSPFKRIDFTIPAGTKVAEMDRNNRTYLHFRSKINYFDVLHHEINQLLNDVVHYCEINDDRSQRIVWGMRCLCAFLKNVDDPSNVSSAMVHPMELTFDILLRFKSLMNPPIDILAISLQTTAQLAFLFHREILTRITNLRLLPYVSSEPLHYTAYGKGINFDSGLVGQYLINHEKNEGNFEFLKSYIILLESYQKLPIDCVMLIEMPGLIFLLREVFPNIHGWRFETEDERNSIYISVMQFFFHILEVNKEELQRNPAKKLLRDVCVYNLLQLDNGMVLLRIIAFGNANLQHVMENESNWIAASGSGLNLTIQLAMTILMQILRLKDNIEKHQVLSPIESIIYTQPKQRDTLRIITTVTSYMNNSFNRRLPILSCRLMRRFAIEFQMSLLACLDMEPDQIRMTFLTRLHDNFESDNLKIGILEFVESCVSKQPGLTAALFKVSYENEKRFLGKSVAKHQITDGILSFISDFLELVSKEKGGIGSARPLHRRVMSLFHALWKNNMQLLVQELIDKSTFWTSLCKPLFEPINGELHVYSQLFNILGIELFRCTQDVKINPNLKSICDKFVEIKVFEPYVTGILEIPTRSIDINEEDSEDTPEWLSRLQSFKDFIVILMKRHYHDVEFTDEAKKYLANKCIETLVQMTERDVDKRVFIVLSEIYLITLLNMKFICIENIDNVAVLMNFLVSAYKEIHPRARESILGIAIKCVEKFESDPSAALNFIRSSVDIMCIELFNVENSLRNPKAESKYSENSLILCVNVLKKLALNYNDGSLCNWYDYFISNKLFYRVLSCLSFIIPLSKRKRVTIELLDMLLMFAKGDCSREIIQCDLNNYLWLKLLPPKELLQAPYIVNAAQSANKWQSLDWWPIYCRGIQLVTELLKQNGFTFLKDALVFAGVHEEYIMDSMLLSKNCMDEQAVKLIRAALELVCELVNYEKQWRLEGSHSMFNLMRTIQILMDHSASLLYRPNILKRLIVEVKESSREYSIIEAPSDDMITATNDLIEIVTLCSKCLMKFSPDLLCLLAEPVFQPSQWHSLVDIQFGPPKMEMGGNCSQLSFGTVISTACIFTKALNSQQYSFDEIPLNYLKQDVNGQETAQPSRTFVSDGATISMRTASNQTLSSTIAATSRPSYSSSLSTSSSSSLIDILYKKMDNQLCVTALENVMTLLASQSLLALKDANLSHREKQLIKRELSNELNIFHDFVKKKILLEGRNILTRKKFGIFPMEDASDTSDNDDDSSEPTTSQGTPRQAPPVRPSSDHRNSMRVKVVRNMHLKLQAPTSSSFEMSHVMSPIGESTPKKGDAMVASTPADNTPKRVRFCPIVDEAGEEDEPVYFSADDVESYNGFSYVKLVEEDYLHFLSGLFQVICQSD